MEFLRIPRAQGWRVQEMQALLGAWDELHVILRLSGPLRLSWAGAAGSHASRTRAHPEHMGT